MNRQSEIKWLHAGIFEDEVGRVQEAQFGFERLSPARDGLKRAYRDAQGRLFGNYNVGKDKDDPITWDQNLSEQWGGFVDENGTWINGQAQGEGSSDVAALWRSGIIKMALIHCLDDDDDDDFPEIGFGGTNRSKVGTHTVYGSDSDVEIIKASTCAKPHEVVDLMRDKSDVVGS